MYSRSGAMSSQRPGTTGRVALFVACFNDVLFPSTGRAVVELLRRLGIGVDVPLGQTCCGQMHINSGYPEAARTLVRRFVETFSAYDTVVTPSASCAGVLALEHVRLARDAGEAALADASEAVAKRVQELSCYLVDTLGVTDVGACFPHRVTYHPTCHSLRGIRVGDRPTRLLAAVKGLELVPLPNAEVCCGFGGTFAVKNPEVSAAMGGDKCHAITSTGAEFVTAVDNSCLAHIGGLLSRSGFAVTPMHLAEILAASEVESPRGFR